MKGALITAPILHVPDVMKLFKVETDMSEYAIGAILSQDIDYQWYPVAYESQKLKPAKRNYLIHDRELLALIHAFKTWRHYLLGNSFEGYTDHWTLQHF